MLQIIDGIEYKLKEAFDMSFLSKYGRVFKIYDDQDSGNICFGVEKDGRKYFIKFAGAPTVEYTGSSADAVIKAVSDNSITGMTDTKISKSLLKNGGL